MNVRERAKRYLDPSGSAELPDAAEVLTMAKELAKRGDFGTARSLLKKRFDRGVPPERLATFQQQMALTTYKDPELRSVEALELALQMVTGGETEPPYAGDEDAFGIPGAIFKRLYAVTGDRIYLERSVRFYERGWNLLRAPYPGINAAFVHDQLADAMDRSEPAAHAHRARARKIRTAILPLVDDIDSDDWAKQTRVEALVGMGRSREAVALLTEQGSGLADKSWVNETTCRQIAGLIAMQRRAGVLEDESLDVFGLLTGQPTGDDESRRQRALDAEALAERFGVALSGGGFRASLFHLGVLAALAEFDLLRRIEVLSCVSGGAIVGAHYALHLRALLEQADTPTHEQYIDVVRECIDTFVGGVTSRNIRMRALSPRGWLHRVRPGKNLSTRLGRLYDELLFSRADADGDSPRSLTRLQFELDGVTSGFNPKRDNWARSAKVPIVLLNATSLNTGRGWQFAATWMGEPPVRTSQRTDSLDYAGRVWYSELDDERIPALGVAAAASACVPGLFPPVALPGLVADRTMRLVDGGVYDNQGTAALLDHDCTRLFVSDASGQITHADKPRRWRLSSALRSSSLSRAALRTRGYEEVAALEADGTPTWYVHLTSGLVGERRQFVDARSDYEEYVPGQSDETGWRTAPTARTPYGIPREMQAALAEIRTDLDKFDAAEADALMYSGYRQTVAMLQDSTDVELPERKDRNGWRFLRVEQVIDDRGDEYATTLTTLRKGRYRFMRRLPRWGSGS